MRRSPRHTLQSASLVIAGGLGAVSLLACDITTPGDPAATVVLAGQIIDTLGAPQAGVRVVGRGFRGNSCEGTAPIAYGTDTSTTDGSYVVTLQALATAFTGCTELTLQGQMEPQVPLRALDVRFREGPAVDTLRANIVFRPAPTTLALPR